MIVCHCNPTTDTQIVEAITERDCATLQDLQEQLGVAVDCEGCVEHVEEMLTSTLVQISYHAKIG